MIILLLVEADYGVSAIMSLSCFFPFRDDHNLHLFLTWGKVQARILFGTEPFISMISNIAMIKLSNSIFNHNWFLQPKCKCIYPYIKYYLESGANFRFKKKITYIKYGI